LSSSAPLSIHRDRSPLDRHSANNLDHLRSAIVELEAQVSRLTAESALADDLRSGIDLSMKMSAEYQSQVENSELKLRIAKMRNQRIEDQAAQLKRQLETKRQEANDKEKILEQLQLDITLLSGDFQRLLERTARHRESITQQDLEVQHFNAYRPFDTFEGDAQLGRDLAPPVRENPSPPREPALPLREPAPPPHEPPSPPARATREPAALRDNISFGAPPPAAPVSPPRSAAELMAELDALCDEKTQLEWRIQRAPAPGVTVSQARRTRAELETRLDAVDRRIGLARLTLKQYGGGHA
jgi:TolA-binding protein